MKRVPHFINFLFLFAIYGIGCWILSGSVDPRIALAVCTALGYLYGSVVTLLDKELQNNS